MSGFQLLQHNCEIFLSLFLYGQHLHVYFPHVFFCLLCFEIYSKLRRLNATTSISTQDIIRLKIYLLNFKSFGHETWPTDRVMGNMFRNSFAWFGGRGTNSMPFFIYQPTTINQKQTAMSLWFFTLLKVALRRSKILNNINQKLIGSIIMLF